MQHSRELDGKRSKKSEIINYAIENCGIASINNAIMIGDKEHDILGAKECRMESVGVLYGYGSFQEISNAGATFIVKSVGGLLKLLND